MLPVQVIVPGSLPGHVLSTTAAPTRQVGQTAVQHDHQYSRAHMLVASHIDVLQDLPETAPVHAKAAVPKPDTQGSAPPTPDAVSIGVDKHAIISKADPGSEAPPLSDVLHQAPPSTSQPSATDAMPGVESLANEQATDNPAN